MRLFIRIAPDANINTAKNYEFKAKQPFHYVLCPIPEFIGEVKCDCGNKADVLLNEEMYKCNTCVALLIPQSKLVENNDISYPITVQTIKEMRFEWSVNGEKWYNLWGRNIEIKDWSALIKDVRTMIIEKKELEINGEYTQETKKMQIY